MKATLGVLSAAVVLAAAVLCWMVMADTRRLGGEPVLDRPEGRFLVSRRGVRTEVSEEDWRRLRTLEVALVPMFPLGLLAFLYLNIAVVAPKLMFRASAIERDDRVRQIAATGRALARAECAGVIGGIGASFGMFRVAVHPGGLVVRVRWIGSVAVRAAEIDSVDVVSSFWRSWNVASIAHASDHARSPIRLACIGDVAFMDAVKRLVDRRS